MSYYFLAASLPLLSLEEPSPLRREEFQQLCSEHLKPKDRRAAEAILDHFPDIPPLHPMIAQWNEQEIQLRNAAAKIRASRRGSDPDSFLRPHQTLDTRIEHEVSEAFSRSHPLERERALDRIRWRGIEEIQGFDPFTSRAILAYALKLILVLRWTALSLEEGLRRGQSIVDTPPDTA